MDVFHLLSANSVAKASESFQECLNTSVRSPTVVITINFLLSSVSLEADLRTGKLNIVIHTNIKENKTFNHFLNIGFYMHIMMLKQIKKTSIILVGDTVQWHPSSLLKKCFFNFIDKLTASHLNIKYNIHQ